jgi:hypothetical protein
MGGIILYTFAMMSFLEALAIVRVDVDAENA